MIETAFKNCEIIVARATPPDAILKFITKTKLSTTFTIPVIVIIYKGLLVSPFARRIAAPKLYTKTKIFPQNEICIYIFA